MAQGKQQKKKNYILRNPGMVMKRFYDGFNHKFLYRKAQTLMFLVNERERFTEMVKQAEENSEELPDWLYLRTYTTEEIKTAIENYVAGNISAATNGAVSTREQFIINAVYAGYYSHRLRENSQWNESIDSINWFIKRAGERYLEAAEYKGYKHGLRVLTGHSRLTIRMNDANGNPQGQGFILGDSEDSLSFPELEDKGEGGLTAVEVTKHFNPKESFEYIQIMQLILDEAMRTRRARINKELLEHLQTIFIDREKLQALRKYFTFSLTV